jgi:GNAT superfamily N-acetyltransferase
MSAPARQITVTLRDGTRVRLRPIRAEDKPLLAHGFQRLSEDSRYRRFFTPMPELRPAELEYLTEVDHRDHEAILAVDERGEPVGVARYVRSASEPDAAEAAVAVVDDWQGRGVGRALMNRLARRARQEGVSRFTALVQADNQAALELIGGVPLSERSGDGGELQLVIELPRRGLGAQLARALRTAAAGSLKATGALTSGPSADRAEPYRDRLAP